MIKFIFYPCNFSAPRVKKLEATNAEQQQQAQAQAQAQATTTLTEAQLVAAAYYQAQFMLLANSAASMPTADDGTGATVDSSALSEYYRQFLGYVWNDRTPTSSDAEDAGTPLPSDKEDEKQEQCPHAGEIQASSEKPNELKTKDKRTSKGERERHKVKRSRKHKRLSAEDSSSAISSTETGTCRGVQKKEDGHHKPLSGQEDVVVGNSHKICNPPDDKRINDQHQSDSFMEPSTSTNTCTHSTTDGAGLMCEEKSYHSPPREMLLLKGCREDQRTKELHRTVQEPHRDLKEAQREHGVQRLRSSSRSSTNSPVKEGMNNQHQSMDKSASGHDTKMHHSTDIDCNSCSPKGENQSPRRHRRDREMKEMQRKMKKHHRESTDDQGLANDSHREKHIKRSQSISQSSYSPVTESANGQYNSSMFDGLVDKSSLNSGTKVPTRANRISPSHHSPTIEKHSPKRRREDRETNKLHRDMNEAQKGMGEPHRETRRTHRETREEHMEIREGHTCREMKEPYREMREMHRETRETHREMMDPHRERMEPHGETRETDREMRESCRVTKEAHRDTREARREVMEVCRETRAACKETREPHRGTCMKETHRATRVVRRESYRDIREPQAQIMELHRDRRMPQRETREEYGDRESSRNRRSHSSSRLSYRFRHRSRSPSYDKENIRGPPSLNRERRSIGEPMDNMRSGQANSLERTAEEISSRRRLSRKRKLSSSSQSTSQHNRKLARREGHQQDIKQTTKKDRHSRSSAMSSHESSPKHSGLLVSPVCFSSDFDDIITPSTPNADEILPYTTDVQLCENRAVLPCDDSRAKRNIMSDIISCPPTPTSELQGQDEGEERTNNDTERKSNTKDQRNNPQANLNSKQTNEKTVELKGQELCLASDETILASVSGDTGGGEQYTEDVVNEDGDKKEASDLEEGEITDSDSDSDGKPESAIKSETRAESEPDRSVERRQENISESYRSQVIVRRAGCGHLLDERRPRRSSCHGSGGHHHQRHSQRSSHHPPLSERRNRHSPPSLKKSNKLYDRDGHMIVKHSHSEGHGQCHHSSRHLRSNLSEQIY